VNLSHNCRSASAIAIARILLKKAEFLLNNAVDAADYREARAEVKRLGVDPDRIKHQRSRTRG
jgi:hypothetical protein